MGNRAARAALPVVAALVAVLAAAPGHADSTASRGVTDATITVGLLRLKSPLTEPLDTAGVRTTGVPLDAYWEAVVADLHARGGVAGRQIETVYHDMDPTRAPTEQRAMLAAACESFTREHEVFAVLDGWYFKDEEWIRCLSDAGVVLLSGNYSEVDDALAAASLYVDVNALSLDRMARLLVASFDRRGFFEGGQVGLVRLAAPAWERAAETALEPALAERGIALAAEAVVASAEDHGRAVSTLRNAGVDRLLVFLRGGPLNGGSSGAFLAEASGHGYHPRLGLSSQDDLPVLARWHTPLQLEGAVAQGWNPYADVAMGQDDRTWPARERCRALMALPVGDGHRDREWAAMHACDWGELLKLAAEAAQEPLTAQSFMAGLEAVGDAFTSAVVESTAFRPGRRDGVDTTRDVAYDLTCHCFRYVSDPWPVDPPPPAGDQGPPATTPRPPPPPSPAEPPPPPVSLQPPAPPAHPPPGSAPPGSSQPAALMAPQPGGVVSQPAPVTAPAAAPAPAPAQAPGVVPAAEQAAFANPAAVPAPAEPEPAPRYAASRHREATTPVESWLLLAAATCMGALTLAAQRGTARRRAYAWALASGSSPGPGRGASRCARRC